jgi:hypothetical protein
LPPTVSQFFLQLFRHVGERVEGKIDSQLVATFHKQCYNLCDDTIFTVGAISYKILIL